MSVCGCLAKFGNVDRQLAVVGKIRRLQRHDITFSFDFLQRHTGGHMATKTGAERMIKLVRWYTRRPVDTHTELVEHNSRAAHCPASFEMQTGNSAIEL